MKPSQEKVKKSLFIIEENLSTLFSRTPFNMEHLLPFYIFKLDNFDFFILSDDFSQRWKEKVGWRQPARSFRHNSIAAPLSEL